MTKLVKLTLKNFKSFKKAEIPISTDSLQLLEVTDQEK